MTQILNYFISFLIVWIYLIPSLVDAYSPFDALKEIPVANRGRFQPMDTYAQQWLFDIYHFKSIKKGDKKKFETFKASPNPSALEILWKLYITGHIPWDKAPFFWIGSSELKNLFYFEVLDNHLSFDFIQKQLLENREKNLQILQPLISYHFLKNYYNPINRGFNVKQELTELSPGLWAIFQDNDIVIGAAPIIFPWQFLSPGMVIKTKAKQLSTSEWQEYKQLAEDTMVLLSSLQNYTHIQEGLWPEEIAYENHFERLQSNQLTPREIDFFLEREYPLSNRLLSSSNLFKALPSRYRKGEWFSLKALKARIYDFHLEKLVPVANFTVYTDIQFNNIRAAYLDLEASTLQLVAFKGVSQNDPEYKILLEKLDIQTKNLAQHLENGYLSLEGRPYAKSSVTEMLYPSLWQLKAELIYQNYPFIPLTIIFYFLAIIFLLLALSLKSVVTQRIAIILLCCAFGVHTLVLGMRCFILQRPPVTNMFETVIYVPWVAVFLGFFLYKIFHNILPLLASTLSALLILIILQTTDLHGNFENVQAVLNSQYWLVVHVLMVVGSYGAFLLSGVLGHIYLLYATRHSTNHNLDLLGKGILQMMYVGTALLIPGTLLGGVWAAESWGRFWDWDPKESWAFISSCVYLIFIHAYTFRYIHFRGLAVGSIIGLQFITFTWYGVNYILGTGLHSYGFGSGGTGYYYAYIMAELIFLLFIFIFLRKRTINA